jgi:hypothetical protein
MHGCRLSFGNEPELNVAFGKAMELLSAKSVNGDTLYYHIAYLGVLPSVVAHPLVWATVPTCDSSHASPTPFCSFHPLMHAGDQIRH